VTEMFETPHLTFMVFASLIFIVKLEPIKEHCAVFGLIAKPTSAGYGRITKGKKHRLKYVTWPVSCVTRMIDLVQSAILSSSGSLLVGGTPCQSLTCYNVILWNLWDFCCLVYTRIMHSHTQLPHHEMD
jgi:hypothetical protein